MGFLIPRRHRSLLIKVLVAIPALFLLGLLLDISPFPHSSPHKGGRGAGRARGDLDHLKEGGGRENIPEAGEENNEEKENVGNKPTEAEEEEEDDKTTMTKEEDSQDNKEVVEAPQPPWDPRGPQPADPDAPGENGRGVNLNKEKADPEKKKLIDKGWKDNAYNQYASDMISLHRSLPDHRDPWCKEEDRNLPVTSLPRTSVIVCFHNEGWTALLRTMHSIINRSPPSLLEQIVLVDDASTDEAPHLKSQLETYLKDFPKVTLVRSPERVGLIRARILGAKHATAQVTTFLDSHCECSEGWLEPLLDRIARNNTAVVCPIIDIISDDSLAYQKSSYIAVGGFDWNLVFNWHGIPDREKKRRSHPAMPVHSPTMAGGLFSIDKAFFEKLGTYDSGFDIWGGENLEISFKTWMCGGTLEIVPCSHVGHIFRKRSPYKWRSGVNVLRRNSIRLAEVWLDEYKEYYYDRIGHDLGNYGDVSSRHKLRENLQCKSFKWYLNNIYPELFVPGDSLASGELRNVAGAGPGREMCADSPAKKGDMNKPVGLYPCHNQGGNQYWMLSKEGEIRRDDSCFDFSGGQVNLYGCHGGKGNQHFEYNHESTRLRHVSHNKCMALAPSKDKLILEACDDSSPAQRWKFGTLKNDTLQTR